MAAGGYGGAGAVAGGLGHWMTLMAEHMTQDHTRMPFLWPKFLSGKFFHLTYIVLNKIALSLISVI